MNRSNLTRLLTLILVVLTTVQATVPQMPIADITTKAILSAVIMFAVVSTTAIKQYLSVEIRNGAIWPTIIIAAIAVLGGLNDLISAIPLSDTANQWIRLSITGLSMILGISSKTLWPTDESKVIEAKKSQLTMQANQ